MFDTLYNYADRDLTAFCDDLTRDYKARGLEAFARWNPYIVEMHDDDGDPIYDVTLKVEDFDVETPYGVVWYSAIVTLCYDACGDWYDTMEWDIYSVYR